MDKKMAVVMVVATFMWVIACMAIRDCGGQLSIDVGGMSRTTVGGR